MKMKELVKLAYRLGYEQAVKQAGPSPREKAMAGVPGAEAPSGPVAKPNPLGSLAAQKAYIREQGGKALSGATPEQKDRFWDDARKFRGNVARARSYVASLVPGVGVGTAAMLAGAGEAAASGIEGRSAGEALRRGAGTAGAVFAGGHLANAATGAAKNIVSGAGGRKLVDRARVGWDAWQDYRSGSDVVRGFVR